MQKVEPTTVVQGIVTIFVLILTILLWAVKNSTRYR